jgi:hypothetical protein
VGTALLYVLVSVRLYGLVLVGTMFSPQTCVNLAHSRVSAILFLGLAVVILGGTSRWWRRTGVLALDLSVREPINHNFS